MVWLVGHFGAGDKEGAPKCTFLLRRAANRKKKTVQRIRKNFKKKKWVEKHTHNMAVLYQVDRHFACVWVQQPSTPPPACFIIKARVHFTCSCRAIGIQRKAWQMKTWLTILFAGVDSIFSQRAKKDENTKVTHSQTQLKQSHWIFQVFQVQQLVLVQRFNRID